MDIYGVARVESLVSRCFDHSPILATCGQLKGEKTKRGRLFRYEVSWDLNKECGPKVAQLWRHYGIHRDLLKKVQHLLFASQKGLIQ